MSTSSEYNILVKAGNWLNGRQGKDYDDFGARKNRSTLGAFYQHGATLSVITGGGILIAGASIAIFLAATGHFSALAALLKSVPLSHHEMWIVSVAGMASGGTVAVIHGSMLGLKKYAKSTVHKDWIAGTKRWNAAQGMHGVRE